LKYAIKECFGNALKVSISKIQENEKLPKIEKIILNNFWQAEELGWAIKDSESVLRYWRRLGSIFEFKDFEKKINYFSQELTIKEKIDKLKLLKANKRVCALPTAPTFYKEMEKLMNETIENVIAQLIQSEKIDKMLIVFDNDLERFEHLGTADYDFGDTEDRECIGEFYMDIMSILGFKYSRGVLNSRL